MEGRPGLIVEDVSRGAEAVAIPLFNELDGRGLGDDQFEYVAEYVFAPGAEERTRAALDKEEQRMREHTLYIQNKDCGIKFNAMVS